MPFFMIQVVHRALNILEYIANDPEKPKALGDIAEDLELNAATCANIIKTLVVREYLEKLDKQKGYLLGPMAYRLSGNEGYRKGLVDAAKDEMQALTKKTNENSLLCMLKNDMRIVIYKVTSENDLQANTSIEKRVYDTSSGRLLVAMLPDDELEKFINQYGLPGKEEWDGVTDRLSMMRQVRKIRKDGYAIQTTKNQITGLALPVYSRGRVQASLSVYMPAFRYSPAIKLEMVSQIKRAADRISKKLN